MGPVRDKRTERGVAVVDLGPYEIDTIYCGECVTLMKDLPNDCIDLTVTSPPYDLVDGDMVTHSGKGLRDYQGYEWDFVSVANELWRVTKPGGVVVWVVGDATVNGSETGSSFRQALYFKRVGFRLHDTMIYEKENPIPQYKTNRYTNQFEFMFVISKDSPLCNYLYLPCTNSGRIDYNYRGQRLSDGSRIPKTKKIINKEKIRTNIWRYDVVNDTASGHHATFPEALARDHILSWSNPGDLILDPFMGSGTVAKMAIETGRHYLGFEISQEYVDLANNRVKGARIPLPGISEAL